MRGRPPVAGLRAVVVVMMLAALPSGAVLAEQISPTLPGVGAKPKAVKRARQPFRPTLPQRNPTRVSADITASIKVDGTSSPLSASGSAAAGMAGASSSLSVAVAGASIPPQAPLEVAAADPASEPETTAALSDAADTKDTASTSEAASPDQQADSAAALAAEDAAADEETSSEIADAETSDTDETSSNDASLDEVTAAEAEEQTSAAEDSSSSDGPAPEPNAVKEEPKELVAAGQPEPVYPSDDAETPQATDAETDDAATVEAAADDVPAEEPAEQAAAVTESSPPKEAARLEAEPVVEPDADQPKETARLQAEAAPESEETKPVKAAVPSHDATVVIDVRPPPTQAEPQADTKPTELAAVTPPSEPAPTPTPAIPSVDRTPDAADDDTQAAAEAAPDSAADPGEAAETKPVETPSGDDAETPASAEDTQAEDTQAEDAHVDDAQVESARSEDAEEPEPAVVEVAPPPPAHPVVAAIRAKLAEPGFRKGFNAATLKGLEDFYGAREGPPLWVTDDGYSPKAKALIAEIGNADDWGLNARDFDVPKADARTSTDDEQAVAELDLVMAVLKYARYAQGGARSPSSFSPLFDQKPEQRGTNTLLTEIAAASDPATYLTSLHPQHEQFKRLRAALVKARARAAANGRNPRNDVEVQLLVVNMERWRWLPRNLGSYHIWNNVPEFNVRVMKGGKPIYLEKTIVGKDKYATPFFSAPMRNIVVHPNWTVPPTIVKEDLAPKLQAQRGGLFSKSKTDMLRGYGLSVSYKGEPVDADSVDWANVNIHTYTFTQDPGPTNVLGKFKFNFPNRHAIYMHDTVQPELFSERIRTLSHGCIRVHEPDRFAALLLAQDKGWSYGQIQRLVAKNESTVIGLNRKVPVHLTYFTATIDENGGLNRFGDIYGIDNRMAAKLFENPARFPVPATAVIAEDSRSRDQGRSARRRGGGGGLDDLISGLFGN